MTEHKSLKRHVRARMTKTGERYTAARRQVLAKASPEPAAAPAPPPPKAAVSPTTGTAFRGDRSSSDEALAARTGRMWGEWFALLETWGARERPHPEIARWLSTEHGVDGWWSQEITVGYEMAIGRRQPGQRPDGYAVSASRTIAVPIERLYAAFVDEAERGEWLAGVILRLRTATPYRTARFDWEDGSTRVAVGFSARDAARSTVALEHSRLADDEAASRQKTFWRERLDALRDRLEAEAGDA